MKKIIYFFVFLPFAIFGELDAPLQRTNVSITVLKKYFDLTYFSQCLATEPYATAVTLEKLMLNGTRPQVWNETTQFVGKCAAEFSYCTSLSKLSETNRSNLSALFNPSVNRLKKWMQENTLTEEALLAMLPERQRQRADVIGLSRKAEVCRQLLDKQESVVLQSLTSNRIVYDEAFLPKINSDNDFVIGPTSLNTAIFLADLIVNYYQMSGVVEHSVQYEVVDICSTLGHSYAIASNRMRTEHDAPFDDKKYFKEVSILTGWELLRRSHYAKERVRPSVDVERQNNHIDSLVESGLRLINNRNIDSINFLMIVALALIF